MHPVLSLIPRGVWAIGSDFKEVSDVREFRQQAQGAQAYTLRRPQAPAQAAASMVQELARTCPFVALHGHADYALCGRAQAVIAGVRSLPLAVYRRFFPSLLLGASTHSITEVEYAFEVGVDFILYGPIWSTPEKAGILSPRGLDALQAVCALPLPVIALGGITNTERALQCKDAGAHGVGVLRVAKDAAALQKMVAALSAGANEFDG